VPCGSGLDQIHSEQTWASPAAGMRQSAAMMKSAFVESLSIGYPLEEQRMSKRRSDYSPAPGGALITKGVGDVDAGGAAGGEPGGEEDREGRETDDCREVHDAHEERDEGNEVDLGHTRREGEESEGGRRLADRPAEEDAG